MSVPPIAISIVMALHNHGEYVLAAIASGVDQSDSLVEVVVVDDGSTDAGPRRVESLADPRVRLLRQSHAGAGAARNLGWSEARGELLCFLDADDLLGPDVLRRHAAALAADPSLDAVYGNVEMFGEASARQPARASRAPGAMLVRRTARVEQTPFAEDLPLVEVVDWVARLDDCGARIGYVPGIALKRRVHAGNHGRSADPNRYPQLLKQILDRRRGIA